MVIYKDEVAGAYPATSLILELREGNRLILSVPSVLPTFAVPFYTYSVVGMPWLYTQKNFNNYHGKIPPYYVHAPIKFKRRRLYNQETPVKVVTHYVIPEPDDKESVYIAIRLYKSMVLPMAFTIHKTKNGTYIPKIIHFNRTRSFISNVLKERTRRLYNFFKFINTGIQLTYMINNGIPLNKGNAIKAIAMFPKDWRDGDGKTT